MCLTGCVFARIFRVIKDRGTEVNKEYQRNADKIDRQFQPNLGDGEPGWVRSKLNEFKKVRGLAFGYYSKMSKDVAELIELLEKAKKGRVMTALNLHNPAEALSWARRGIMRSFGLGHRPWLVKTENSCFSRGGKWRE